MQENMKEYFSEKEARERRLAIYTEKIQETVLNKSAETIRSLVDERHNQKMTQQEISDITGIKPSNLARFESGGRVPTLIVLEKYANALGKHIEIKMHLGDGQGAFFMKNSKHFPKKKLTISSLYFKMVNHKTNGGLQMTKTKSMIYCGLFTALIAAGAFIKIPVPVVPFTLQYLFTMLAGLFLGSRRGMISVVAYMLLGLAGLPIFSEGGGIWYIFKPSFGYIIGFCLGTYVTGLIAERLKQKTVFHYLLANLAGLMIVYACGMVYYYVICNYVIDTPIGIWPLILYCFLLAVPGDIALSVLGAVIAKRVRPVVLQYLFDSKSNVRLEREELVK